MKPQRWRAVRALFDELVDLTPGERAERLAEQCADDPELRHAVETLLAAEAEAEERIAGRMLGLPVPADPLGLAGRILSHFRVLELLGTGGMGAVYSAEDTRLNRPVALKLPWPQFHPDSSAKTRFLHEARSAGALDHPSLCSIYEVGETEDGMLFLAMALYRGETIKARLTREQRLSVSDALEIARQITQGLAAAHRAGVVHRDLKPGNVMLLPDGTVKILDFGLAKVRDYSVTESGRMLGTAAYMAPEQIRGDSVDGRADLWALGVLVYEMLTGRQPFGGQHEISIAHAILYERAVAPSVLRSDIPATIEDVILTLLSKDPAHRYPDAEAVAADLAAIQLGRPLSSHRRHLPVSQRALRRLRRHARGALAMLVLVVLALDALLAVWMRANPSLVRSRMARGSVSHVLWVDDTPENNAAVARQLRGHGITVTTALTTADAVHRYDPTAHQLVISDVGRYEGADNAYVARAGLEMLTQLKARSDKVQLVFCTSPRAVTAYRGEALSLGALDIFDDCSAILQLIGF